MAKGDTEKQQVFSKLQEIFRNAFFENEKILRIPINDVEIKVSLTTAKDNLGEANSATSDFAFVSEISKPKVETEVTSAELDNIQILMAKLGM